MNHLRTSVARDVETSKIVPWLPERVRNVIDWIVLFPGRAARSLGRWLTSNTFLGLAGAAALLAATVGQKTGANAWVIENTTAPLLTNTSRTGNELPFPVQAADRLKHKAETKWRLSMHPDHIHANTPIASIPYNPNDPLNKIIKQLSGQDNITIEQFVAEHPEYQK